MSDEENINENEQVPLHASRLGAYGRDFVEVSQPKGAFNFLLALKVFLLVTAIILAIVTFSWTFFTKIDYSNVPSIDIEESLKKNELVQPRFDSTDSHGQPYSLMADSAVQDEDSDDVILRHPSGEINLLSGRGLYVQAVQGVYQDVKKRLTLLEEVKLSDDFGYVMNMESMFLDFDQNYLKVDSPISGQGPAGQLTAVGAEANMDNGILVFKGPAKLTLYPEMLNGGLKELR